MKRTASMFILIFILFSTINTTASCECAKNYIIPIDISIYGDYLRMPHYAFIEDGITYAPVRSLCEVLGASVLWIQEANTIFVDKDNVELIFDVNNNKCLINDVLINSKIQIVEDCAYVPIRLLAETFDFYVGWDSTYYEVTISKDGLYIDENHMALYTRNEVVWLSKIVQKEVGNESFECRLGVANVILNRVKSSYFPNTIYEVIFDTTYGVQFPPAHNGGLDNLLLDNSTIIAAKCALNGENNVSQSLYFIGAYVNGSWAEHNRPYTCKIGNEKFFN